MGRLARLLKFVLTLPKDIERDGAVVVIKQTHNNKLKTLAKPGMEWPI